MLDTPPQEGSAAADAHLSGASGDGAQQKRSPFLLAPVGGSSSKVLWQISRYPGSQATKLNLAIARLWTHFTAARLRQRHHRRSFREGLQRRIPCAAFVQVTVRQA